MAEFLHGDITKRTIGAAFEVHRVLGPGFMESVYEKALCAELQTCEVQFERQVKVPVYYKDVLVGEPRLDLVVEERVVVELKAINELADIHTAIALSYLKATHLSVALLLNFASLTLEHKRVALKHRPGVSA